MSGEVARIQLKEKRESMIAKACEKMTAPQEGNRVGKGGCKPGSRSSKRCHAKEPGLPPNRHPHTNDKWSGVAVKAGQNGSKQFRGKDFVREDHTSKLIETPTNPILERLVASFGLQRTR